MKRDFVFVALLVFFPVTQLSAVAPDLPISFDFGGETSPVQEPYTQLAWSTVYDDATGYGWQTAVESGDRGIAAPSNLDRDFNRKIGGVGTFLVDLADDDYDVTFRFWEQYTQGPFDVVVESEVAISDLTVTGMADPYIVDVNDVAVSDGQLTVGFPTTTANWFINALTIKPSTTQLFDFGQVSSAVMLGWNQVTQDDTYTPVVGYGWSRTVTHGARTAVADVRRMDFCRDTTGAPASFLVDLDNGRYEVSLTVGDQYALSAGAIDITAEGNLIAENLAYSNNEWVTVTARVQITDGQMDLGFSNDGGGQWIVNDLIIEKPAGSCGAPGTVYLDTDMNHDCYVNLMDFASLASDWLKCTDPGNTECDQYWWFD